MNVKQAVTENEETCSANPLWVTESNASICGPMMNKIPDLFFFLFSSLTLCFDLAAGVNPFSEVA